MCGRRKTYICSHQVSEIKTKSAILPISVEQRRENNRKLVFKEIKILNFTSSFEMRWAKHKPVCSSLEGEGKQPIV